QAAREGLPVRLGVAATSAGSLTALRSKQREIETRLGVAVPTETWPRSGTDAQAYRAALATGRFNAAIIAAPDPMHHELASAAVEAGLHTLLVKPFVTNLADGVDLVRKAAGAGVYGAVEFHKRFDTANRLIRQRIESGSIGRPLVFHIEYSQRKIVPTEHFAAWSARTTIFQYLGVHYVDMVHFLTGALPLRAMATGQKAYLADRGLDTFDAMQVMVEWSMPGGHRFISNHLTHWVDPNTTSAMSDQKLQVIGTEGRIDSDQKNRGLQVVTDAGGIEDVNPYFSQFVPADDATEDFAGYGAESFKQFLIDVAAIRAGRLKTADLATQRATFASSLVSQAVLEAAQASLEAENTWVPVDLSWRER
ncbi:MAG: Gfo/Idh/MocA family oxidoreductase, partial [Phycisphaeraceae bacterium]|nr:Gfo/Idh/MocA family oxidoreductase [Phycisphaeraceae bacterium]